MMTDKQRQEQAKQDLRNVMATVGGRRVIARILSMAGMHANPFNHSGSVTAYNCGRQSVAQDIAADLAKACPDDWVRMQCEVDKIDLTETADA